MNTVIRFGTDGWRAVIAEEFTFDNVRRVAAAMASYLKTVSAKPRVTIGYDTRFHSQAFARAAAETLSDSGCGVLLSNGYLSTPALSSSVPDTTAHGGIMISASHNPPQFNGIKFKTPQGGSAPEAVTALFERFLARRPSAPAAVKGSITECDLLTAYLKRVKSSVDFAAIKRHRGSFIADPMYGAGIGYLERMLTGTSCRVRQIHDRLDPLFGGLHPEPIEDYLGDLKAAVVKNRADAGLATDGDADRIGVVDDTGRYLTPHQVFPLLLYYLCHYRGKRGKVVQAISLGYVSERIARDFGLDFEETPVGFKYIAQRIESGNILIGGEESGGYGYGDYLPERDGLLNSLKIIEMLAVTGKKLSRLVAEVEKKYGRSAYMRTDFVNPGIEKSEFVREMAHAAPSRIAGCKVRMVKDYDGVEFVLEDDSWLLLRPSGTEPVIRVYAESDDIEKTRKIIAWGSRAVRSLQFQR